MFVAFTLSSIFRSYEHFTIAAEGQKIEIENWNLCLSTIEQWDFYDVPYLYDIWHTVKDFHLLPTGFKLPTFHMKLMNWKYKCI